MSKKRHLTATLHITDEARPQHGGDWPQSLNMAVEAVDVHVATGNGGRIALRWLRPDGSRRELTYQRLADESSRVAAGFERLGMRRGERVALLLPRRPELHIATLGALKAGMVVCPLFSAFGPEPVLQRLRLGGIVTLVTTPALYEKRVRPSRSEVPALRHVVLVDDQAQDRSAGLEAGSDDGLVSWTALADPAGAGYRVPATGPEEPALLHFTSGTTGMPKGALHVHAAVLAHRSTARYALGLRDGDVFWCTADPGWVTGMSYGVIAPLACGVTAIVDEPEFSANHWCDVLEQQRVNVWYTAPTAIRRLMRAGFEPVRTHDISALRHVASVGEPLDAGSVHWGEQALGQPVHDTWWQTETGAIMIANVPGQPVRAGSMGRPMPGISVATLARGADGRAAVVDGRVTVVNEPDGIGELAVKVPWPSMFRGYLGDPERYARAFADGWYLTGDLARIDAEGWVWFVSRADDVIKSAGHLIGPFEVESVLKSHPSVADAGVFGLPDEVVGEIVAARIVLRAGVTADANTRRSIVAEARKRLGAAVAPRDVAFVETLPYTRSGKVMRRLLRSQALGLAAGDVSTLEEAAK